MPMTSPSAVASSIGPAEPVFVTSEPEVAAGAGRECFGGPDVMVHQRSEVAMAGLGGDPVDRVDRGTVHSCGRGVAGTQRVTGDRDAVEAGSDGALLGRAC